MRKFFRTMYVAAVWTLLAISVVLFSLVLRVSFQVKAADGDTEVAWSLFGVPLITAWRAGSEMGAQLHWGAWGALLLVPLVVGVAVATTRAIIWRRDRHGRGRSTDVLDGRLESHAGHLLISHQDIRTAPASRRSEGAQHE